jgi:hypothetical protein
MQTTNEKNTTAPTVAPMMISFDAERADVVDGDVEDGDAGVDVWGVTDDWGTIKEACSSVVREANVK